MHSLIAKTEVRSLGPILSEVGILCEHRGCDNWITNTMLLFVVALHGDTPQTRLWCDEHEAELAD